MALGVVLVATGCGSSSKTTAPTTTAPAPTSAPTTAAPTTTVAPSTTSTTTPAGPTAPLTGLPQPDAAALNRSAVVVKIDNVVGALPQTGINAADVVYEEMVEGGLTRLAAVFQSQLPDPVGPIRSGRTTDEGIIDDLNYPVFVYSGANADFLAALGQQPVVNVNADSNGSLFFRAGPNVAPHNYFANATALAALALPGKGAPPALFDYATATSAPNAGAAPTATATLQFPSASALWTWSAKSGTWLRTQNGAADVDIKGVQISAANVVVQSIPYVTALTEANGTAIPEGEQVGTGQAWILTKGTMVNATWTRPSLTAVATYKDSAGNPILLTPGQTWVELLPNNLTPSFTP
jgi:Protein of unknown function (DUF3048) N-terminal domain/Protein of unknown function (DUF3048) C-terminal domain